MLGEAEPVTGTPGDGVTAADDALVAATPGDVLGGRYQLLELIGEGGMSRVYRALDSQRDAPAGLDEYVAVKVFTRRFTDDAAAFSMVQADIQQLQALQHPNIVRLFSCGLEASTVFVSMEYLVGRSLYTRLHAQRADGSPSGIDRTEAASIITTVAGALEYAHRRQVVHGDLKPGNVILTDAGGLKVIDFALASLSARRKTAVERRDTAQRHVAAAVTPRYASPQLMARNKPENTDDIYALACLAYELLTGVHPFDAAADAQPAKFPPPQRPGLSAPQYAAVTRALEPDKRNRTPTVRQFMQEFADPVVGAPRKARALGIALVVLLLAGAWWYLQKPRTPPVPVAVATHPTPSTPVPPATAGVDKPGTVIRDCPTCPPMTVLPTGEFNQGTAGAARPSAYEKPMHRVRIRSPIVISSRDITVGDFREFAAATGRDMRGCDTYDGEWRHRSNASWKDPGFAQTDAHPVTCTSWDDATAFAQWLSGKTGHRYRLPTASEWEYAARAGETAERPWAADGTAACTHANVADQSAARRYPGWEVFACSDGYVNTAPVGSFKASPFGLVDMLGNVFQWTQDCWHGDYAGAPTDGSARKDGDCTQHELRGGSWFSSPPYVRAAYRNHFAAAYRTSSVGFRLVRESGT